MFFLRFLDNIRLLAIWFLQDGDGDLLAVFLICFSLSTRICNICISLYIYREREKRNGKYIPVGEKNARTICRDLCVHSMST